MIEKMVKCPHCEGFGNNIDCYDYTIGSAETIAYCHCYNCDNNFVVRCEVLKEGEC